MSKYTQVAQFSIKGRFQGFVEEGNKLKHIRLATSEGECWIKISKLLRPNLSANLITGDWIQVSGKRKSDQKSGKFKLKADSLTALVPNHNKTVPPEKATPLKTKATILVCQKSDCIKRGGVTISQALEKGLRDRGLESEVTIKRTSCMKQCKAGPHLIMPDKTRYRETHPSEIPALLDKHFPADKTAKNLAVPVELT